MSDHRVVPDAIVAEALEVAGAAAIVWGVEHFAEDLVRASTSLDASTFALAPSSSPAPNRTSSRPQSQRHFGVLLRSPLVTLWVPTSPSAWSLSASARS